MIYRQYFKRIIDFFLSLFALLVLSPLMLVIVILVHTKLGSPVFYTALRPGKNERLFRMYKFRTMENKKDKHGQLLHDSLRITKFGQILRSTSLDELPELFNILKGDMSFVGPRPLAVQYLPFYSQSEKIRHSVKPGLTGLAQISGRNALNWESKFTYDLEYIEKQSFMFDLKIIFKTIVKVFVRENIGIRGVDGLEDFDLYRIRQNELQKRS